MMTDPIADMLTRIRNANRLYHEKVVVRHSKIVEEMLKKMKQEGFIKDYARMEENGRPKLTVYLKYGSDGEKVIRHLDRISRPGRRVYQSVKELSKVLGGLGISIVSTSKGILTDRECHQNKIGGEVLCTIW